MHTLNRALDYIGLGYYDNAIDDFTSAIKIKPDFVKAYFERGLIYYELGTWKHIYKEGSIARFYRKAINDFTSVIEIEPNNSDAYFERGCAKYKLYLEFCEDFKRACDLGSGKGCEYFKGEWDFKFSYENDGCD
jgi:protein O-mannosyl-transferase